MGMGLKNVDPVKPDPIAGLREDNLTFPSTSKSRVSRRFSYAHYSRTMSNGEVRDRKWLVYSKQVDKVFCFSCKLFNPLNCKSSLAHDGFRDWKHITERLQEHEASMEHITSMISWNELKNRLSKHETVDKEIAASDIEREGALKASFATNSSYCEISWQTQFGILRIQ